MISTILPVVILADAGIPDMDPCLRRDDEGGTSFGTRSYVIPMMQGEGT